MKQRIKRRNPIPRIAKDATFAVRLSSANKAKKKRIKAVHDDDTSSEDNSTRPLKQVKHECPETPTSGISKKNEEKFSKNRKRDDANEEESNLFDVKFQRQSSTQTCLEQSPLLLPMMDPFPNDDDGDNMEPCSLEKPSVVSTSPESKSGSTNSKDDATVQTNPIDTQMMQQIMTAMQNQNEHVNLEMKEMKDLLEDQSQQLQRLQSMWEEEKKKRDAFQQWYLRMEDWFQHNTCTCCSPPPKIVRSLQQGEDEDDILCPSTEPPFQEESLSIRSIVASAAKFASKENEQIDPESKIKAKPHMKEEMCRTISPPTKPDGTPSNQEDDSEHLPPTTHKKPKRVQIQNPEKTFKYKEVCRKKHVRRTLNGYSCEHCDKFVDAVCHGNDVFDKNEFLNNCSRHRARFSPDPTPDGFWELSFADSIAARRKDSD